MEIWKPVVVHSGKYSSRYEVSSYGRVRAHENARIKGCRPGRILFQGKDNRGYCQVYLYCQMKQTTFKVHRLVATAFIGDRSVGMTIDHKDGYKTNNKIDNLEYVSASENTRRSYKNGLRDNQLAKQSERQRCAGKKINIQIANKIRVDVAAGVKRKLLAQTFGIHEMTIGEIVRNEIWVE